MAETTTQAPTVEVKAPPNVYTVLLIAAILLLGAALGLVLHNLMAESPAGYGLSFGALFDSGELPDPIRPISP